MNKAHYLSLTLMIILILSACQKSSIELPPAKSSGLEVSCDSYSVTASALRDQPDAPNYIGGYDSPILMNLVANMDDYYDSPIAGEIYDRITNQSVSFLESYEQTKAMQDEAIAAGDEEEVVKYDAILSNYHFSSEINTVSDGEGYLAFTSNITWSESDGVKHHKVEAFNVDVNEKRFLTLSDLFKDKDYRKVLEDKIKTIIDKTTSYKEELSLDTHAPTLLNEEQFFFSSDKLVIYYNPGEIAPEDKGVICFEIPMKEIGNHLTDRFAKQSTIAVTRPSKLFAFSTRGGNDGDEYSE